MSDNILSAVLTFSLLAAGTAAIGSEMVGSHRSAAKATEVATLPTVTVIGERLAAADPVMLPTVTITGSRHPETRIAGGDSDIAQRAQ